MEWQPIDTNPKDGTDFIGISFGIGGLGDPERHVYYWSDRWERFMVEYDSDWDAPQPEAWCAIPSFCNQ